MIRDECWSGHKILHCYWNTDIGLINSMINSCWNKDIGSLDKSRPVNRFAVTRIWIKVGSFSNLCSCTLPIYVTLVSITPTTLWFLQQPANPNPWSSIQPSIFRNPCCRCVRVKRSGYVNASPDKRSPNNACSETFFSNADSNTMKTNSEW